MTVAHDEFRGMGLSGVGESLDEGAVVVDVMVVFEGEGVEAIDRKTPDKYMFSLDNMVMVIR